MCDGLNGINRGLYHGGDGVWTEVEASVNDHTILCDEEGRSLYRWVRDGVDEDVRAVERLGGHKFGDDGSGMGGVVDMWVSPYNV